MTTALDAASVQCVGFYGKLPMRGDFLSRSLPHEFIAPWDAWLQHAIAASRAQLGEGWLPAYLNAPIWRFVMAAEVCGPAPAMGVLMPSVDRVGRYFPLALVFRPASCDAPMAMLAGAAAWFTALEQVALATLEDAAELETFERDVASLAPPPLPNAPDVRRHAQETALAVPVDGDAVEAAAPAFVDALLAAPRTAWTLWWTCGSDVVAPMLLGATGLPPPEGFAALLDGQWERWGWTNR